jgi:HupE / UreJ protein
MIALRTPRREPPHEPCRKRSRKAWWCLGLMLVLACPLAQAHIASNGFLNLNVDRSQVAGALELTIRDGELAVGLDHDGDGKVTWGELRGSQEALQRYVQGHLHLAGDAAQCRMQFSPVEVNERVDGRYLWLPFAADCGGVFKRLSIEYQVLDVEDPSHRGLLTLSANGATQTAVLGGASQARLFDLEHPSPWPAFIEYLHAGVWHIWSGIDHLLFLLSLLLPAVLVRRQNRWEAVPMAAPAFANIVKVVTAFTLAHSITLSLAAFDVIRLPGRLTESVIAASIIVAALNNVFPRVTEGRWRIAFAFGLLHGFGFASVLAEMGLPKDARLVSLIAFNLGVEAGQLAVVLAVMPLAYVLRSTAFYRRGVMPWGSSAIAALALVWFVQRAVG